MTRPDLTRPDSIMTLFDGLFIGKYQRYKREILTQSSFKSKNCVINIWDLSFWYFGNYPLFGIVEISVILDKFLIITFDWNRNIIFWYFYQKYLVHIYQKKYIYKKLICRWKKKIINDFFAVLFFKLLS